MARIGPNWNTQIHANLMFERFSEVLKGSPRDGVSIVENISYGNHERQALDIFLPEDSGERPPVVLFVHGGAFVAGHRNRTSMIYSNVLVYLARRGIAGINIGYRLANHVTYPGASEDIARCVGWARSNAARYGWDDRRIFLMSHSAGAAHAGTYAYDPRFQPADGSDLAGMIVLSGRVRVDNLPENPNAAKVEQYYGSDISMYHDLSPVSHVDAGSVPTFVAWAEFENPLIDLYCIELVHRLAEAKRRAPPSMWVSKHNHVSLVAHIGTSDDQLGQAVVDFIRNPR